MFLILSTINVAGFSKTAAFLLSLIPSFIMGTGSAFGEATILGYLHNFPKDFVSGWSSGTGLAGVIGALVTLSFHLDHIESKIMYLVISPVCILYFSSFLLIQRFYLKYLADVRKSLLDSDIVLKTEPSESLINDTVKNKNMNWKNGKKAFGKSFRYILNLAAVYYLEYTILAGFGERVAKKGYIIGINNDYQYEYFSLCYQIGVFISRSSLLIVKHIKFVEIFTILQLIFFILWFVNVYTGFISIPAIAFINFVIIGLMGGSSYVLCFYHILKSHSISNNLKELSVNIGSMFNDFGILLSSITILIFNLTIMKID